MREVAIPGVEQYVRQLQQAQSLQNTASPEGGMVGRYFVAPSVTQRLAAALKRMKGDEMESQAQAGIDAARKQQLEAMQYALTGQRPQAPLKQNQDGGFVAAQRPTTQAEVDASFDARQAANREQMGIAQSYPGQAPANPVMAERQSMIQRMIASGNPELVRQAAQMMMADQEYMRTRADTRADTLDQRQYQDNRDETQFGRELQLIGIQNQGKMSALARQLQEAGIDPASPEGQKLLRAGIERATTHAPAANVNVAPTVNVKADESLSKQVGGIMEANMNKLTGAVNLARSADRMLSAINSGSVIAGPTADMRLSLAQFGQMIGVGGKDTEETILRTRRVVRELADAAVEARQLLAGQGQVTENEAKAVEKARSGQIDELTIPEIRAIAELNIKHAHFLNQGYQNKFNALPPELRPFYEVNGANQLPEIPAPLGDIKESDLDRALRKYGR